MSLSIDEVNELRDAIIDGFNTLDRLDALVLEATGRPLDHFALGGSTLPQRIGLMIQNMQHDGTLWDVISTAHTKAEHNARIAAIHQRLFSPLLNLANPAKALFIEIDTALMDRTELREYAKMLISVHGRRILVVTGPPESGKSYSLKYLTFLQRAKGGFKVRYLDLKKLALRNSRKPEIDAKALGEEIASKLGFQNMIDSNQGQSIWSALRLPDILGRHNEQATTWNRRFCDKLVKELDEAGVCFWLVLDHFVKVALSYDARELLSELTTRVTTDAQLLRLILLDYDEIDKLPILMGDQEYLHEEIRPLNKDDVIKFFDLFYSQNPATTDPLAGVVANVLRQVDLSQIGYMRPLGMAVAQEAQRLHKESVSQ